MEFDTQKESEQNSKNKFKTEHEELICKDGFCYLPNIANNQQINDENINIFDPL
tara:strand:- start:681 stop:842 length:162 start_codon:yes stop_codon:yes gene_type:complete